MIDGGMSKKNKSVGACGTVGRQERVWVGKPEGKRPLGKPKCRLGDNIKMDIQNVGLTLNGLVWLRIRTVGGLL
jgi:hypothetical protein